MKVKKTKFDGVFKIGKNLATLNLVPGEKVYGEKLIQLNNKEYRIWDHWRSKPSAAIKNGLKHFPIKKGFKVLYLGAATGTTVSHFSDIVCREGIIYAIEISARVLRELIPLAEKRKNIVPILADARKIEGYQNLVISFVDLVYCDVADPQEVEIFTRNCLAFLRPKGYGMIAIKSRSIDVIKKPKIVFQEARKKLEKNFEILDFVRLDPYQADHGFFVCRLK